jgi:hypothetical protein
MVLPAVLVGGDATGRAGAVSLDELSFSSDNSEGEATGLNAGTSFVSVCVVTLAVTNFCFRFLFLLLLHGDFCFGWLCAV